MNLDVTSWKDDEKWRKPMSIQDKYNNLIKKKYIYRLFCCEITGDCVVRDNTVYLTVNIHMWYCKY